MHLPRTVGMSALIVALLAHAGCKKDQALAPEPLKLATGRIIHVSTDQRTEFRTIQAAVNAVDPATPGWTRINILAGTYDEAVVVPADRPRVILAGAGAEKTLLRRKATFLTQDNRKHCEIPLTVRADDVVVRDMTLRNEGMAAGGQYDIALKLAGDRIAVENVALRGCHNTFVAGGEDNRFYMAGCDIEGQGDFVTVRSAGYMTDCTFRAVRGWRGEGYILYKRGRPGAGYLRQSPLVVRKCTFTGINTDASPTYATRLSSDAMVYFLDNRFENAIGAGQPVVSFFHAHQPHSAWLYRRGNRGNLGNVRWDTYTSHDRPGRTGAADRPELPMAKNQAGQPMVIELTADQAAGVTAAGILKWDGAAALKALR